MMQRCGGLRIIRVFFFEARDVCFQKAASHALVPYLDCPFVPRAMPSRIKKAGRYHCRKGLVKSPDHSCKIL